MNQAEARTGIRRDGHGRNRVLFAICLIIGALCTVAVTAQDTPFTSQNPFETSGERPIKLFGAGGAPVPFPPADGDTVLWSAVAESRGKPADGLDAEDFTFKVDGKKREIAWFARRPAAETAASEGDEFSAPGWYVALFDLTIADPLMMKEAATQLVEAIGTRLDQDEQVAVVFFDGRLEVVTPFTRDPAAIRAALDKLPDRSVYSVHDFYGRRVKVSGRGETKITSTLDQSDDTAQHNFAAYRFFTEIRRLALELAKVPGRKQVMLFSGGFNRKWLAKEDVAYLRMVDAMCRAATVVYTYNAVDEDYLDRILETEGIRRKRVEKAGVTELKYADKFLSELAESTGGLSWAAKEKDGTADIVQALFRDGRHHYLLGFPRGAGTRTGVFLPCEVRAGGEADIRAPLGFYNN
jgi:VWFA-related protein